MKRRSKEKSQENLGSRLLTPQENERVVDLLGRRCVVSTLASQVRFLGDRIFCISADLHTTMETALKTISCSEFNVVVDFR